MNRILTFHCLLFLSLAIGHSPVVMAQPDEIERLYGQGVHAFHSGLLDESLAAFDQAVSLGARDPRIFYYRGVVQDARGFKDAASADFQTGSELEFQSQGRFYSVGRALERVQGTVRLQIETARQSARLSAIQRSIPGAGNPMTGLLEEIPVVPDPLPVTAARPTINFPDTTGGTYPNTPFSNPTPSNNEPASNPPTTDEAMPAGEGDSADEPKESDDAGDSKNERPADDDGAAEEPDQSDPFGDESDSANDKKEESDDSGGDKPDDDDPFGDGN